MKPAPAEPSAAQALLLALQELHDTLLGPDATAIENAAQRASSAVRALERQPPPPALLAQLAALNHKAGTLVAARQAAARWALSRLASDGTTLYDSDGQPAAARTPRRLASA